MKLLLLELDEEWTDAKVEQLLRGAFEHSKDGEFDYREFINHIFYGDTDATKGPSAKTPLVDAAEAEPGVATAEAESGTGHVVSVLGDMSRVAHTEQLDLDGLSEMQKLHRPSAAAWASAVDEAAEFIDTAVRPLLSHTSRFSGSKTFHCILDGRLYLGGAEVTADELRAVGITHVVRVLENTMHVVLPEDELHSIFSVQVADVQNTDLRPFFPQMCNFVAEALKHGGKVYVHCAQGRSRSCTMVLSYLISEEKMSLRDAWVHVLQRRDVSAINNGFLAQLVDLDEAIHGGQSLPLLAAFVVKNRWNRNVLADSSRKFDAAEFLELWGDPSANTRDPGMAIVILKASMTSLRRLLEAIPEEDLGSSDCSLEPLHTKCCAELYEQLHTLVAIPC